MRHHIRRTALSLQRPTLQPRGSTTPFEHGLRLAASASSSSPESRVALLTVLHHLLGAAEQLARFIPPPLLTAKPLQCPQVAASLRTHPVASPYRALRQSKLLLEIRNVHKPLHNRSSSNFRFCATPLPSAAFDPNSLSFHRTRALRLWHS